MTRPVAIVAGTSNTGKLLELRGLLGPLGFRVIGPADLGIDMDVEETGTTFEENAVLKANAFYARTGELVLADDSGLYVDALDGAPGVWSARYGGPGRTDRDRVQLLLEALRAVPASNRTARFVCCIAIAQPGKHARVFRGEVEGRIADRARGNDGFGYDPIFIPLGSSSTYAEMGRDQKARTSHRARALADAMIYLRELSARYTKT